MFGTESENQDNASYQEPTYNTAIQVVLMLRYLEETPEGEMEVSKLAEKLEVHPRTVKRYIEAIGGALDGGGDTPYIERIRKGRTPYAKINRPVTQTMSFTLMNYAALRLATASLKSVDPDSFGMLHEEAADQVRDTQKRGGADLRALENFEDAFLYVPYGPKRYTEDTSRVIRRVLQGIEKRNPLKMDYPKGEDAQERVVHPLAIVLYRDALYLYAKQVKPKPSPERLRYFSVDRIGSIELLRKQTFQRPKDFKPEELGSTSLGIWEMGNPERVCLRFFDQGAQYVLERNWPNMVSCETVAPDTVELQMDVPVTPEVIAWLAGWGRLVEVIEPEELVEELRNHLADALDYYV